MSENVKELTKVELEEILKSDLPVMVDFWADWCNPCVALGPILENVSKNYPDIVFGKVNVDEESELATAFDITSIPYVVKIIDGKYSDSFLGLHNEEFVEKFFEK